MIRLCPGCQQSDESPRHSVVTSLADMTSADFHYVCHAKLGCPLCLAVVDSAEACGFDPTNGAALTLHIEEIDPAGAHIAAGGAHL